MTNGELIDLLTQFPREMELFHRLYTVDQKPGDSRLVVDPGRFRVFVPPPIHNPDGTTTVTLTQKKVSAVLTVDWPLIQDHKWFARMSSTGRWYASTNVRSGYHADGRVRYISRDIHHFLLPGVPLVDHRDGDGLNNLRPNLREASKSLNAFNQIQRGDNHGIHQYRDSGKWCAYLRVGTRNGYLGVVDTREEAQAARDLAETKLPAYYTREAIRMSV